MVMILQEGGPGAGRGSPGEHGESTLGLMKLTNGSTNKLK